jgi:hypothetical protein
VLILLALPMLVLVGTIVCLLLGNWSQLSLFLPGLIALPVFALVPNLGGHGVPLSKPPDTAKSSRRGLNVMLIMFIAFGLAALASLAWSQGWFWWLIAVEAVGAVAVYALMRASLARAVWDDR